MKGSLVGALSLSGFWVVCSIQKDVFVLGCIRSHYRRAAYFCHMFPLLYLNTCSSKLDLLIQVLFIQTYVRVPGAKLLLLQSSEKIIGRFIVGEMIKNVCMERTLFPVYVCVILHFLDQTSDQKKPTTTLTSSRCIRLKRSRLVASVTSCSGMILALLRATSAPASCVLMETKYIAV